MKLNKSSTTNERRRQLKELKISANELGHSRKLLPVRTPLGQFNNSYAAAKHHKMSLWTFWGKVMDPRDNGFELVSLHDAG
jgi:hypothetical protein